jgi:cyclopropane fatty-acyl-phospholipid synthase-like methyltransferase
VPIDDGDEIQYDPASHYDRVTAAWNLLLGDELHYGVFDTGEEDLPSATLALTSRMIDAARLDPGNEVLDVGCGTGAPACHLAATKGVTVTGITTSRVGVAEAEARARSAGVSDRVSFAVADGMANGMPDASYDRTWVMESSHLMPDREALVAECARVLRPGGRFVLCDIIRRRDLPFMEVRRLRKEFGLLRDVFGEARMEPLAHYRGLAEAHDLVVDVEEDLTAATRPTFDRWQQNAEEHRPAVVEALGAHGWQQFVDSCDVLRTFWDDGTLGYGLIAAQRR